MLQELGLLNDDGKKITSRKRSSTSMQSPDDQAVMDQWNWEIMHFCDCANYHPKMCACIYWCSALSRYRMSRFYVCVQETQVQDSQGPAPPAPLEPQIEDTFGDGLEGGEEEHMSDEDSVVEPVTCHIDPEPSPEPEIPAPDQHSASEPHAAVDVPPDGELDEKLQVKGTFKDHVDRHHFCLSQAQHQYAFTCMHMVQGKYCKHRSSKCSCTFCTIGAGVQMHFITCHACRAIETYFICVHVVRYVLKFRIVTVAGYKAPGRDSGSTGRFSHGPGPGSLRSYREKGQ